MSIFNQLGNFLSTVFVALLFNLTLNFVVVFNFLIGIHVKQKHIRIYLVDLSIDIIFCHISFYKAAFKKQTRCI